MESRTPNMLTPTPPNMSTHQRCPFRRFQAASISHLSPPTPLTPLQRQTPHVFMYTHTSIVPSAVSSPRASCTKLMTASRAKASSLVAWVHSHRVSGPFKSPYLYLGLQIYTLCSVLCVCGQEAGRGMAAAGKGRRRKATHLTGCVCTRQAHILLQSKHGPWLPMTNVKIQKRQGILSLNTLIQNAKRTHRMP